MSDPLVLVPILSLPPADIVQPWDVVAIVQNGQTKRAASSQLPGAGIVQFTADGSAIIYTLPKGKVLTKFAIKGTVDFTLGVDTPSKTYLEGEEITAGTAAFFTVDIFDWDAPVDVTFSGLVGVVEIKCFLLG